MLIPNRVWTSLKDNSVAASGTEDSLLTAMQRKWLMYRHVFLYKVAPGADLQKITETLNGLPAQIPGIRNWTLGRHRPAPGSAGGRWDYGLVCDFDSFEALQTYNNHPSHLEVVRTLMPLLAANAVCDFEFEPTQVRPRGI